MAPDNVTVWVAAEPPPIVRVPYIRPPPAKVLEELAVASERTIVDEEPLNVRFVVVAADQGDVGLEQVTVEVPNVNDLVVPPLIENVGHVTEYPDVLKPPEFNKIEDVAVLVVVRASLRVVVPLTLSILIATA